MTIQHVALECRPDGADAEVTFWVLLGFAEVAPPEALRQRSRWVQRGATQVHVLLADDPVVAPRSHVAVVVEDYVQAQERLRAAGHEVADRAEHWGAARCFTRSPAGHRVELMAAPP